MPKSKATEWREANPEKWEAQRKAYAQRRRELRRKAYAALAPGDKAAANKARRARYKADPDAPIKAREYGRLSVLRKCGMSLQAARAWMRRIPKVCAICGTERHLGVDHCHVTMRVRGLLCRHCNLALGYLRDDPRRVTAALTYLQTH
jgi:hypothetical protein